MKHEKTDYRAMAKRVDELLINNSFISASYIGSSVAGRPIPLITLGNEKAARSILYVGCHHGMEWITTDILLRFAEDYAELYRCDDSVCGIRLRQLFKSVCIHIVPMLNPDGAELQIHGKDEKNPLADRLERMSGGDFSNWQANGRGVDLNHNYNALFDEYKLLERAEGISGGAPTRYSGEYPESEPETGALCNLIRFSGNISMILTLHSQGEEIYYSSGSVIPPEGERIADTLSHLSGYAKAKPEGMASYGGLTDWFIREFGLPSFTVECGKGKNPLPATDAPAIYRRLRDMLFTAPILAMS